jgi:hypothetical protein
MGSPCSRPVLCQLSYAPRFAEQDCTGRLAGIRSGMSDYELDKGNLDDTEEAKEDELQAEQEGKGYGGDEGEREAALTDE